MKKISTCRILAKPVCALFLWGGISQPASAHPLVLILPVAAPVAAVSLPAGSQCLYLAYDQNGNRISRSASVISQSSASWGGSVFGCSHWGSSS
ncbi:MAG: hypothetical protein U0975_08430 [Erythrobacter sp.]|nr:hypothetical protein [Erythrobacter sp.]MDZ4272682.1 hypothetical protein [Erythrobacter sp.]